MDTAKAATWQPWKDMSPKPSHTSRLLPSKRSFRSGKIRAAFAFFPLPKPTVSVSVERQQKTSPSGFECRQSSAFGALTFQCVSFSCILPLHGGNYKVLNRCSIMYWLK